MFHICPNTFFPPHLLTLADYPSDSLNGFCKVVIYNIVFCWLIFCAKFDCNVIQSFVPCIYCGISL